MNVQLNSKGSYKKLSSDCKHSTLCCFEHTAHTVLQKTALFCESDELAVQLVTHSKHLDHRVKTVNIAEVLIR
jgi:hypothetical protein